MFLNSLVRVTFIKATFVLARGIHICPLSPSPPLPSSLRNLHPSPLTLFVVVHLLTIHDCTSWIMYIVQY